MTGHSQNMVSRRVARLGVTAAALVAFGLGPLITSPAHADADAGDAVSSVDAAAGGAVTQFQDTLTAALDLIVDDLNNYSPEIEAGLGLGSLLCGILCNL